jgi:cobalt-zinc-cadmium efflux system protein
MNDQAIHFECHVELSDNSRISETNRIYEQIDKILRKKHHIAHLTIQFEYQKCKGHEMNHE